MNYNSKYSIFLSSVNYSSKISDLRGVALGISEFLAKSRRNVGTLGHPPPAPHTGICTSTVCIQVEDSLVGIEIL